ncbi:MerR family transcriptional regulator [Lachnospiraceae bacterium 46-15]
MNIKEAEALTGITKQNIRFYEKKGLLHPHRNQENDYREYADEDIETLKKIKILRKLDISLEHIQRILNGEDMNPIIQQQLDLLLEKKNDLDAAIQMCQFLLHTEISSMDTEKVLKKMEDMEKEGRHFMTILNDYKKVANVETKKEFSFVPDNMALNPTEFTEALCKYGTDNNLNLSVTHEGMYPKFEIDGVEYEAYRSFGRFGAVITCQMTHPELLEKEYADIPKENSRIYRKIHWAVFHLAVPVAGFLYFCLVSKNILLAAWMTIVYLCMLRFGFRIFRAK